MIDKKKGGLLTTLYRQPQSVFTSQELALLWQEDNKDHLKAKISYYVKQSALRHLRRGIYAKDEHYNPLELATSIYRPSYISFETVLQAKGLIFQHYDSIFVAASWPRELVIDKNKFVFRKLKNEVLYNNQGIVNKNNYNIATPERAFLDMIYLFPRYYFDNLRPLDWEKCHQLVNLYSNKQLVKRLDKYQQNYAQ